MSTHPPSGRASAVTVLCVIVAILAVLGGVNSYRVSVRYAESYPDAFGLERSHVRFAPIVAQVPPNGRVGYISDIEPSAENYSVLFLATQYALAPRELITLSEANHPDLAVGNFTRPVDYAAAGAAKGYASVTDLGNGVVLFRRK